MGRGRKRGLFRWLRGAVPDAPLAREPVSLPEGFAELPLQDESGRRFILIRSEPAGEYERGIIGGSFWGTDDLRWMLRQVFAAAEGGCLIDVGANIGAVSIPIALDGTPVIAVELLPPNCLKLHLARLVNETPHLRIVQAAASSSQGLLGYNGDEAWGSVGPSDSRAVALSLDTILALAQLDDPAFGRQGGVLAIKIDVEGHELEVLRGAGRLMAAYRPVIIFESIESADEGEEQASKACKRLLREQDYRLFLQRGGRLAPRTEHDLQEGLVADYVAVPREKMALIASVPVRDLSPAERVNWIAEMSQVPVYLHRRAAAAAIEAIRKEDAAYCELTRAVLAELKADPDPGVSARAHRADEGSA